MSRVVANGGKKILCLWVIKKFMRLRSGIDEKDPTSLDKEGVHSSELLLRVASPKTTTALVTFFLPHIIIFLGLFLLMPYKFTL